jgi:ParB/RepB/Spo0J family partition protein
MAGRLGEAVTGQVMPVFEEKTQKISLDEIGDKYQCYRFANPKVETDLKSSLVRHGQLAPIIVCREAGVYELIDGFKRWRASRELPHIDRLEARILTADGGMVKAAMMRVNQERKGLSCMEEALIVCAMHRQDQLPQNRIAELLNRHPSWVCRRVAMAEKLDKKIVEHMRLGLIPGSLGRYLAKLPRGNQQAVLAAVETHQLSCRETAALVEELLGRVDPSEEDVAQVAKKIVSKRIASKKGEKATNKKQGKPAITTLLERMRESCQDVLDSCKRHQVQLLWKSRKASMNLQDTLDVAQQAIVLIRPQEPVDGDASQ